MSKFTLVTLCMMLVLMVVAINAATFEMAFTDDKIIKGSTVMTQLKFTGVDLSTITLTPAYSKAELDANSEAHLWNFKTDNIVQHLESLSGYSSQVCFDDVTGQAVAKWSSSSSGVLSFSTRDFYTLSNIASTSPQTIAWTINCALPIDTTEVPGAFGVTFAGSDFQTPAVAVTLSQADNLITLAAAANGFTTPLVDFKKAKVSSGPTGPLPSAIIDVEFTTDSKGNYTITFENGPMPLPFYSKGNEFAPFFCSAGANKSFARAVYIIDGSSGISGVIVSVQKPSEKDVIKCSIFTTMNLQNSQFVASERMTVRISNTRVTVSRTIDFKPLPSTFYVGTQHSSSTALVVVALAQSLSFSTTPLNNNSTIVFSFSKQINIARIVLNEDTSTSGSSYHANQNCGGILATSFVDTDNNKLILKDVLLSGSLPELYCSFTFAGSDVFAYNTDADSATLSISIDGGDLVNLFGNGDKAAPINLPTVGTFNDYDQEHLETEKDGQITIVDTFHFHDQYSVFHTWMNNPQLIVGINGSQLFNMENYKDQVTCEATSPSHSIYKPLKLKFNEQMNTWIGKLDSLIEQQVYAIKIRCTRVVPVIIKYGIDITPESSLEVRIVNLLDGKRHIGEASASASMHSRQQPETQSQSFPEKSLTPVCISADYFLPAIISPEIDVAAIVHNQSSKKAIESPTGWKLTPVSVQTSFSSSYSSSYTPLYNLIELWEYQYGVVVSNFKAFYMMSIDLFAPRSNADAFANLFNVVDDSSSPPLGIYYTLQSSPLHLTECYMGENVSATAGSTPALSTADITSTGDYAKDFVATSLTGKYGTNPILEYGSQKLEIPVASHSPVKGCGVQNGLYVTVNTGAGFDFTDAQGASAKSHFSTFLGYNRATQYCQANESCTYNADCASGLICAKGVCMTQATYNPPFVRAATLDSLMRADEYQIMLTLFSASGLHNEYYNSAQQSTIFGFGIIAAIVVAMLF